MIKIGLDLDDTVNNWWIHYIEKFGQPKSDAEITRNVTQVLSKDRDFWLSLSIKNRPDFDVKLYCTKRVNPKTWTKQFLRENNLPIAPIYQVYSQISRKSSRIKGRCDVFVDDSLTNFIEMNLHGVPCLLMDSEANQSWGPIGRVYSLDYDEIEETYRLFLDTIYPYFKELLNDNHSVA